MRKDQPPEDFAALLEEFDGKPTGRRPKRAYAVGDVVRAKVISVGREQVFLTLPDGKTEGMLGLDQLRDEEGNVAVAAGDEIEARVAEFGDKADSVVLRRLVRRGPEARAELAQAFELGIPVEGTITGVNKGGLDVNVAGVRGFCPISQLEMRQVDDAGSYIGQTFSFKITRHEEDRRGVNLVLSRRALLEEEGRIRAVATREKLTPGAVLSGVVVAIKDFGAFIDIGGIEGLLPASELGHTRGVRTSDVLSVGQTLEVQVLRIEKTDDHRRSERISFSLKSLTANPWDEAPTQFPVGMKLKGTVVRVEPFGAFVEIAPGIEGLLHVGQLVPETERAQVRHAKELIKPGDTREVTVLGVDRDRRRISLGIGDRKDVVDAEDLAAGRAAGGSGKLGTLGDLFAKLKL